MDIPASAARLRIFVGEDKWHGDRRLYEAIALKARQSQLAGAAIFRGTLGFGRSTRLHTEEALLSGDLPIVIEIVDAASKIKAFVDLLCEVPDIGLMTVEPVTVVRCGPKIGGTP